MSRCEVDIFVLEEDYRYTVSIGLDSYLPLISLIDLVCPFCFRRPSLALFLTPEGEARAKHNAANHKGANLKPCACVPACLSAFV